MLRLLISWKHMDVGLRGLVSVSDSAKNEFLGQWFIEVDHNTIKHQPHWGSRTLPPIHEIVGCEVDSLARAYMAGYNHNSEVYKWMAPIEPEEVEKLTKS